MAVRARAASAELARMTTSAKNDALLAIAKALEAHADEIRGANAADVARAKENGLASAMVDRLTLTPARFRAASRSARCASRSA